MIHTWATLYTDASFKNRSGGGWAVWARSELGRIVRFGRCPEYVETNMQAELAAIYAGLYLISDNWPSVTAVLVRSDCQGALEWLRLTNDAKRAGARRLQHRIAALLRERPLYLRAKWVKGHQRRTKGTPSWLNNRVDELARRGRLRAVEYG